MEINRKTMNDKNKKNYPIKFKISKELKSLVDRSIEKLKHADIEMSYSSFTRWSLKRLSEEILKSESVKVSFEG